MKQSNTNYCRSRCRGQIGYAIGGLPLAFFSLVFFIAIVFQGHKMEDAFTTNLMAIGSVVLFVIGLIMIYIGIKNSLFLENSAMAKSIRSQLDSAWDRSLSARELFALVDKDIAENGRWFGRLAIGNEWILGATAMRLDRVRGIFYEMEFHTFNNKSSYSYTLYLYDHNQRGQVHAMGNEDLMMVAFRQICLLVPEAVSGHASQKEAFLKQAEAPTFEADFQARKALRSAQQKDQTQVPQDVVLFDSRGNVTSRVTDEALNQARLALQEKGSHFRLRCTSSLVYQHGSLLFLNCGREANRYFLMYGFVQEADSALLLYRLWLAPADLLEPVRRFVRHKEIPDFQGWERRTLKLSRGE